MSFCFPALALAPIFLSVLLFESGQVWREKGLGPKFPNAIALSSEQLFEAGQLLHDSVGSFGADQRQVERPRVVAEERDP